jgi:hypothetical protein
MRFNPWLVFVIALLASACTTLPSSERADFDNPPPTIAKNIAALHPGAIVFVVDTEREILRRGRPLSPDEMRVAKEVGVAHPEQVRVLVHDDFIQPRDRAFLLLARRLGIDIEAEQAGRTAGHGIELKRRFARSPRVLAHELTHVTQYERLGTPALVRDYLTQLLMVGYERAPIEMQARANEHIR